MSDDIPGAVRKFCYERDLERCRLCGSNRNHHLHHIMYRSQGGPHTPDNLITLCMDCHAVVHGYKGFYQEVLRGLLTQPPAVTGRQYMRWNRITPP